MASGIITLTKTAGAHLAAQILWESTSNGSAANTSTVTATLQLKKNNYAETTGSFYGALTVGTETVSGYKWFKLVNEWQDIQTITTTITHNYDGTGTCYLYGKVLGAGGTTTSSANVNGSATVALDTIPRFATLVSAPDFTDEENPVITYANPAGENIENLRACISLDGEEADIPWRELSKTGSSCTFVLTEEEREILRNASPENSRNVVFLLESAIGGITERSSLSGTLSIVNAGPTLSPGVTDVNPATLALTGDSSKLVRYYSDAAVTFGAQAYKGAAIAGRMVTCGDQSLTEDGTFTAVESGSFAFAAADSRGNPVSQTLERELIPYVKLSCSLSNNLPNTDGELDVEATGNFFNGSFGTQENSLGVYYRWKPQTGDYSDWIPMDAAAEGDSYTATAVLRDLDYRAAYVVQVYAEDKLESAVSEEKTVRALPVFDWGQDDFAFHVPVEMNGSRITGLGSPAEDSDGATKGYVDRAISQISFLDRVYPVNSIYLSYSHVNPAELFGGAWERIANSFLLGAAETDAIGETGGEAEHTLTVEEMPSHNHYILGRANSGNTSLDIVNSYATYGTTRDLYTDPAGGSLPHNNMPPYVMVSIWRRIA